VRDGYSFGKLVTSLVMVPLIIVWAAIDWPSRDVQVVVLVAIGVFSVVMAGKIAPRFLAKWERDR
jgi:ABC-type nitrate/sulfonate/bicarbonate transport system permease component